MTPFDANPDNDAGHSLNQEDLIAFHLHELSLPQERALHRVLRTNPALQAESLAIASTLRAFPKHEAALPLDAAALDRNWQSLRNALPVLAPAAIPTRTLFPCWAFPALAASALATTAVILTLHHTTNATPATIATNRSISSANTTPPAPNPASTSDSALSSSPFAPFSVPTPSSIRHTPLVGHGSQQPYPTFAAISPTSAPAAPPTGTNPPQAIISSPSETPAANASIATTQQPQSQPAPTFTPISETRGHTRIHHHHSTDITLAVLGNISSARPFTATQGTGSSAVIASLTQSTTPSIGVLASFHQQFSPWRGYRATASYSQPTFEYTYSLAADSSSGNIVDENAYELSGTYVVEGPHHRRISTAAEAGAGLLALLPASPNLSSVPVVNAYRPAAVFGAYAEFTLTRRLALHAGYRALLYKGPSAALTYGSIVPTTPGNLTFGSEPVVGLTYRFHEARE